MNQRFRHSDENAVYKWVSLAAAQGMAQAKGSQETLESILTSEQLAEGKKRAADFKAKTTSK